MDLPDLGLQWVYARIAWGMVCAALVFACLPARLAPRSRGAAGGLVGLSMWLPGAASPAHWLGLMFQYPSVTLAMCCVGLALNRAIRQGASTAPAPRFAFALALCGALLYLDATGWLHLEIYARGADPALAPTAALLLGAATVAWMVRAHGGSHTARAGLLQSNAPAWAVLAGITVFSVARLPTGNLFDALLDPLLWLWAVATTLRVAAHGLWRR